MTAGMDNLTCPHCSAPVLNDRRLAGQVVACPTCKNPFQMPPAVPLAPSAPSRPAPAAPAPPPPALADEEPAFSFDEPAPARPPRPPARPSRSPVSKPRVSGPPESSSEPWYYAFLEQYSTLALIVGLVGAGVTFLFLVLLLLGLLRAGEWLYAIGTLLVGLTGVALLVLGVLFGVALIRLLVDSARNLRELRQRQEQHRDNHG